MDEFEIGKSINIDSHKYIIQGSARGGMGLVLFCEKYKKEFTSLVYRNRLAVKIFFPNNDINQVRNELQVWQKIHHPNIVSIITISMVNDYLGASMVWFDEGAMTFDKIYKKGGLGEIKKMLLQVVDALQYAYALKIMHLDIKPANILLRGGEYQLADWGIAKFSSTSAKNKDPRSGGTIPYMAPERFNSEPDSPAADIYSLGITAFEMALNTLPFDVYGVHEMIDATVSGRTEIRIREIVESCLPRKWGSFILDCCSSNLSRRPKDYSNVLRLLNDVEV